MLNLVSKDFKLIHKYILNISELVLCADFGPCSASCGRGTQTCENRCENGKFGDQECPIVNRTNVRICENKKCEGNL